MTITATVLASGDHKNVTEVTAANEPDIDSTPNNDNGDQSEDDEDNAVVTPPGATITPTNTPTATPKVSCNNTCSANADCANGLICSNSQCRNPECIPETDCTCAP